MLQYTMAISLPKAIFNTLEYIKKYAQLPNAVLYPEFAQQDYERARDFLLAYKNNQETFKNYRREIERFLQWSWLIRKESILKLKREDIELFIEFCQKPLKTWIGFNHVPRSNSNWRPFIVTLAKAKIKAGIKLDKDNYALSEAAIKIMFATIGSFYNFLIQEEHVSVNPVKLIKQKNKYFRKKAGTAHIRRLSPDQWLYLIRAAQNMAEEQPDKHNRTLFIIQALYGMYLRISELVSSERWQAQMNSFYKDADGNWWFKVIGKGNKERDISVSDDMLEAFRQYRLSLNLSPLPMTTEDTPLLPKFAGRGSITDTRHIRLIVQQCFDRAYLLMLQENKQEDAEELKVATVHWLRHTGISDDVKIRPREHVRDDAGHSSGAITDKYIDIEKRERSLSAKHKKLIKT